MNEDKIIKEKAHGVVLETSCQIVTDEIRGVFDEIHEAHTAKTPIYIMPIS